MQHRTIIALHGSFGSGRILQADMGDPAWIDEYPDWPGMDRMLQIIDTHAPVILIGYSLGGSRIAEISAYTGGTGIVGAVLYESPNLENVIPGGNFPIIWIENDNGRGYRNGTRTVNAFGIEMMNSEYGWKDKHPALTMMGEGRHLKRVWDFSRWLPRRRLAHGWDVRLNDQIWNVIRNW